MSWPHCEADNPSTYAAGYDVSESDLVTAIVTADQAKLAADVADGKITEAQATQDSADLTQLVTEEVERTGGAPTGRFVGRGMGIDQSRVIDTTATLTGTTADDVTAALAGGQTLAAYAEAHGSTESALVDAIVAAEQAQLIQQVAAGTLTQVQADEINADLTARVTDLVEQVGGPHSCPGMQGPNTTPSTNNAPTPNRRNVLTAWARPGRSEAAGSRHFRRIACFRDVTRRTSLPLSFFTAFRMTT